MSIPHIWIRNFRWIFSSEWLRYFQRKSYFYRVSGDISDLVGENVRIRFTFFTDTYVEEDGWYIDDAGIG